VCALLVVLLLAGCTTHGRIGALPTISNPTDAAEIVVIREWRYLMGGGNFTISLDGAPLYGIATSEHVVIPVSTGYHVVGVAAKGPGLSEVTVSVQAVARQRYYFRVETGSVFSPGPLLLPISANVGEALMAKTTRISP
jgi:hypothetical protein